MSDKTKFSVDGLSKLNSELLQLDAKTGGAILRRAGRKAMLPVEAAMKRGARKKSGDLQDSIGIQASSSKGRSASRIARITVGPIKKTHGRGGDKRSLNNLKEKAIAQEFGNAKQSAQPFIRPALENQVETVLRDLIDEFAKQLTQKND